MRSVAFVDRATFSFAGNVFPNAVCLGDFDGDGKSELCAGSADGVLAVFRAGSAASSKPWMAARNMGHVTATAFGDLLNIGRDVLVAVSMGGFLNVFDADSFCAGDAGEIVPAYGQRLPPNIKQALVADVNGDGFNELVVAMTDRVVRTYQWRHSDDDGSQSYRLKGELVSQLKWEFPDDVGGCSLTRDEAGEPMLLVAQPGGAYHKLKFNRDFVVDEEPAIYAPLEDCVDGETVCEILGTLPNKTAGEGDGGNNIGRKMTNNYSSFVIAGVDGTLAFGQDDKVVWKRKLDNELFCLRHMDVNGNGADEILVSTWEGQTFIFSQDGMATMFFLDEPISAFTCGLYAVDGKNLPVLVYATHSNDIHVFYNISLAKGQELRKLSSPVNKQTVGCLLYGHPRGEERS